jgi:hypothetical protein
LASSLLDTDFRRELWWPGKKMALNWGCIRLSVAAEKPDDGWTMKAL